MTGPIVYVFTQNPSLLLPKITVISPKPNFFFLFFLLCHHLKIQTLSTVGDPLSSAVLFTSPSDHCYELASLNRGQWRSVADKVVAARSLNRLSIPHEHLVYLSFNSLTLFKLRNFSASSLEIQTILPFDSPKYCYEAPPNSKMGISLSNSNKNPQILPPHKLHPHPYRHKLHFPSPLPLSPPSLIGFLLIHLLTIILSISSSSSSFVTSSSRAHAAHMAATAITVIFQGAVALLIFSRTDGFLENTKSYVQEEDGVGYWGFGFGYV